MTFKRFLGRHPATINPREAFRVPFLKRILWHTHMKNVHGLPPPITKQSLSDHDARIVLNSSGAGMKGKPVVARNRGGENLKNSHRVHVPRRHLAWGYKVADETQKRPLDDRPLGRRTSQSDRLHY
jgi:hypothetical protein